MRSLREIVTGFHSSTLKHQEVCRGCALGKYTKTIFPSSDSRSAGVLDLIHTDVCGPCHNFPWWSGVLCYFH
jgi:hypothetical protein